MPVKTEQTSSTVTRSESNPVQKREKKMRKKRKMIRQKVEGESSTSSSESDVVQQALVNSVIPIGLIHPVQLDSHLNPGFVHFLTIETETKTQNSTTSWTVNANSSSSSYQWKQ